MLVAHDFLHFFNDIGSFKNRVPKGTLVCILLFVPSHFVPLMAGYRCRMPLASLKINIFDFRSVGF